MNLAKLAAPLLAAALLFPALAATDAFAQDPGPNIYPNLAADLIGMGDVLVIDVRSREEVDESGVLAGAVHVEHTDFEGLKQAIGDDQQRPTVLYCGTGRRVAMAIDALRDAGYARLVNAGGFDDLQAALEDGN